MRIVPFEPSPLKGTILGDLQVQGVGQTRALRPEGTRDWLMACTLSGLGYVQVDGEETIMRRGSLLLIAPGTRHDYGHLHEDGAWRDIWVHFHPRAHWLPWLVWPQLGRGTMLLDVSEALDEIEVEMHRMLECFRSASRLSDDLALNHLERVILLCDGLNPLQKTVGLDPRIRQSLDIVAERFDQPLSVKALSREVGMSRSRFTILFSEQMAMSPQAYIESVRLDRAAQFLRMSRLGIAQVAERTGFSNAYYFSTRFRRRHGVPPTQYRESVDEAGRPTL
ncbi:helix-turn-helix domain-containing protein [Oceaniglobus trochenteri]|uniref:helix-turn-helix domain-containing protein n=1 Tax=Oceaniglobus trochenteri TaxID=2763260 RepID=UPI001D0013E0|nr:helix-turn-helix domain-containing protein [Oceaniglobus trochenteri]